MSLDLSVVVALEHRSRPRVSRLLEAIDASALVAVGSGVVESVELRMGESSDAAPVDDTIAFNGIARVVHERLATGVVGAAAWNQLAAGVAVTVAVFLEPAIYLAPTALRELAGAFGDPRVGAADARRLPREHPKDYDPRTGDTGYASSGALAVRQTAFDAIGGFDAQWFPGRGADVDLSWRIRAMGLATVHVPGAVVVSDDSLDADAMREGTDGALAHLLLAQKWGGNDTVDAVLERFARGSADEQHAAERFRGLRAAGDLPEPVDRAGTVAEFRDGEFARVRWARR